MNVEQFKNDMGEMLSQEMGMTKTSEGTYTKKLNLSIEVSDRGWLKIKCESEDRKFANLLELSFSLIQKEIQARKTNAKERAKLWIGDIIKDTLTHPASKRF